MRTDQSCFYIKTIGKRNFGQGKQKNTDEENKNEDSMARCHELRSNISLSTMFLYLSSVLSSVSIHIHTRLGIREFHPCFVLYSIVLIKVTGKMRICCAVLCSARSSGWWWYTTLIIVLICYRREREQQQWWDGLICCWLRVVVMLWKEYPKSHTRRNEMIMI